jgi:hypothetical protein
VDGEDGTIAGKNRQGSGAGGGQAASVISSTSSAAGLDKARDWRWIVSR